MTAGERTANRRPSDGRDEMNLADFPISVLQRQQPVETDGVKRDTAVFEAGRYDAQSRQRMRQRVVLETTSRHGLPTPADEQVVLALLYVGKHAHDFSDPVIHFAPRQLFSIMGWAPNSRSYTRLREVLRRLKALVIRYENAWWDMAGRAYEAEVATGIIAEYELARQTGGRKEGAKVPPSWICWSPRFQQSLANGNLKKLDLAKLFQLKLPTSQRMYRFLDKRFHGTARVEMELRDFACGHIGMANIPNIAELKRRLVPAINELVAIEFLAPASVNERFIKVQPGVWRVRFNAAAGARNQPTESLPPEPRPTGTSEESRLAEAFYEAWGMPETSVGERDIAQARKLLAEQGMDAALAILPHLVHVLGRSWPQCRSFKGAFDKYGADALRAYRQAQGRELRVAERRVQSHEQKREQSTTMGEQEALLKRWRGLPSAERAWLENAVLERWPEHRTRPAILERLCLAELGRMG